MIQHSMPVANTATADFTLQLKSETAAMHRQLESAKISQALMHPAVQLEDYYNYLQALKPVISFTEQIIFPFLTNVIPALEQRRKLHLLENDIAYLETWQQFPGFTETSFQPGEMSEIIAMAHMYVMEGSTLGGKMIAKHISNSIVLPLGGTSYFSCYGEHTGRMWKSFMEKFSSYAVRSRKTNEIIEAANAVFSNLYQHFENYSR